MKPAPDLITATVLLIFVETVPVDPTGGQRLRGVVAFINRVVVALNDAYYLRPQRGAVAVLYQQRCGITGKLGASPVTSASGWAGGRISSALPTAHRCRCNDWNVSHRSAPAGSCQQAREVHQAARHPDRIHHR